MLMKWVLNFKKMLMLCTIICVADKAFSQKDSIYYDCLIIEKLGRNTCKQFLFGFTYMDPVIEYNSMIYTIKSIGEPIAKSPFLRVKGNVFYDYMYRSKTDTPYVQGNVQQHTERINLEVLIKDNYPIRVALNSRQTNSMFYKGFWDIGLHFDRSTYLRQVKNNFYEKYRLALAADKARKILDSTLLANKQLLKSMQANTKIDYGPQSSIEKKEQQINSAIGLKSIPHDLKLNDRLGKYVNKIDTINNHLIAQKAKVDSLQKKADSLKNSIQLKLAKLKSVLNKTTDFSEVQQLLKNDSLSSFSVKEKKIMKLLSAVRNINIGRTNINYTELTTQNVLLTGINIEANTRFYFAVAGGKVDYRFRDFLNKGNDRSDQYLLAARFGIGNIDKKALILTMYQGKKNNIVSAFADTLNNTIPVLGYSIEGIWNKDAFTGITAEFAKSTKPISGVTGTYDTKSALWNFKEPENMGISIKAKTRLPFGTRFNGFFRKTGRSFQSFSMFNYNTDQVAWHIRVDQSFWKNRVAITAMLRRNDFVNPYAERTFKTSTIFTSVNAVVRVPKWPVLSFGYFPGSQLYIENGSVLKENAYYILNGSVMYQYLLKNTTAVTSFNYNSYNNMATDSGFITYRGTNYYLSQQIDLGSWQLQAGYTYNNQPMLKFTTLELGSDLKIGKRLTLGASLKYTLGSNIPTYWGERISTQINAGKLGTIQIHYEQSYLPMFTQKLFPVETGRVSYYKSF